MLGDITPSLMRVGAVEPELNDELWLQTHLDIRKSGRIYAFMTHCVEAIKKRRDLIEGLWGTTLVPADVAEITAASLLLQTA
jgi:hypothetical protein